MLAIELRRSSKTILLNFDEITSANYLKIEEDVVAVEFRGLHACSIFVCFNSDFTVCLKEKTEEYFGICAIEAWMHLTKDVDPRDLSVNQIVALEKILSSESEN